MLSNDETPQTAQIHALADKPVDDEKATSLFNRKGKPQPLRGRIRAASAHGVVTRRQMGR